jgi:hypothetical protein
MIYAYASKLELETVTPHMELATGTRRLPRSNGSGRALCITPD